MMHVTKSRHVLVRKEKSVAGGGGGGDGGGIAVVVVAPSANLYKYVFTDECALKRLGICGFTPQW